MTFENTTFATGSAAAAALDRSRKARDAAIAANPEKSGQEDTDLASIREKGFSTFVKELEERKMKQLREEILKGMGISEEDLSKMDPKKRAEVERMIADKIRQRMAAQSVVQADGPNAAMGSSPPQVLAGGAAWGTAPALLQAMQEADAALAAKAQTGENDPAKPAGR